MRPAPARAPERGSITIVAAAMVAIAIVTTLGLADVGAALLARSRARGAADAAALAAAQELAIPSGADPAAIAAEYATSNGAELLSCACEPGTFEAAVEVRVETTRLTLLLGTRWVVARSRAVVDLPSSEQEV